MTEQGRTSALLKAAGSAIEVPSAPVDRILSSARRKAQRARRAAVTAAVAAVAGLALGVTALTQPGEGGARVADRPPGQIPWEEAILLPGRDDAVSLRFIGATRARTDDPCAGRYEVSAREDSETVTLTLRRLPSERVGPEFACSLGGSDVYIGVKLDAPLGTRSLVDGATGDRREASDRRRDLEYAAVRPAFGGRDQALAMGALGVDPTTGCLWLESEGGRTPLLLHGAEYRVDLGADPPTVLRGDQPVAAAGDQVSLGGGFGAPGVPGCPVGGDAFVGYVE
jgi:hypothetical protein